MRIPYLLSLQFQSMCGWERSAALNDKIPPFLVFIAAGIQSDPIDSIEIDIVLKKKWA